jgi:hypothetical protein
MDRRFEPILRFAPALDGQLFSGRGADSLNRVVERTLISGRQGQDPMTKSDKEKKRSPFVDPRDPWISGRTGVLIIAVLSVAMAIFMGINIYKMGGIGPAILWGLGSAVVVWILFGALYLFNLLFRTKR